MATVNPKIMVNSVKRFLKISFETLCQNIQQRLVAVIKERKVKEYQDNKFNNTRSSQVVIFQLLKARKWLKH
ncbi:MAG: hypothetical protein U0X91_14510 [Spirosomataceae bacterium]